MSVGQTHVSAQFVENSTLASLASLWGSDTIKVALVTGITPSITDSDPRWGAGGGTNYSTSEVTAGGNYAAGGFTLTGTTVTLSGANTNLNATSPISWAANASNPTNAQWAIFYDSTDSGKHVFGFMDLGGTVSLVPGLQINLNGVASGTQIVFQGAAT
jgi:hypothetical protein